MRKETVKIRVDAVCLSCSKSTICELDEDKLFCEYKLEDTTDAATCEAWECNENMFDMCWVGVEMINFEERK